MSAARVRRRVAERRAEALVAPLVRAKQRLHRRVVRIAGRPVDAPVDAQAPTAPPAPAARQCSTSASSQGALTRSSSADAVTSRISFQGSVSSRPARSSAPPLDLDLQAVVEQPQARRSGLALQSPTDSPCRQRIGHRVQQGRVVIDQQPALRAAQPRRQFAQVGAGAACQVEDDTASPPTQRWRRSAAQSKAADAAARAARSKGSRRASQSALKPLIARFPAARPARRRSAPPLSASPANRWRALRAPGRQRARQAGSSMARRSASRSAGASPGGTSTPASAGTVSGMAPAQLLTHRQAACQRLGQRHAVALVERRQHEQVGARVQRIQARAGPSSPCQVTRSSRPWRATAWRSARGAGRHRARRCRRSADARAGPRRPASASISTRMALARRQRGDAQQRQARRRRSPRQAAPGRCPARPRRCARPARRSRPAPAPSTRW